MPDWIKQLHSMLTEEASVTLITVIRVSGSAPREVGARMLVSQRMHYGTIGGGHLEYRAIRIARDRLLSESAANECRTFALGPALGQCCGGSVELLFEQATQRTQWVAALSAPMTEKSWLCRNVGQNVVDDYQVVSAAGAAGPLQSVDADSAVARLAEYEQALWFCEPLYSDMPEVWLFGAGHVGKAVVAQLALLQCRIVLIDQRADMLQLPEEQSGDSTILLRDCMTCADEVADAPARACFVVMTHSHAIDYEICRAVLSRGDFRFLGLIGSDTKRNQFVRRLKHRGMPDSLTNRMHCPLGLGNIRSRRPESIALSLAMQLSELWEQNN